MISLRRLQMLAAGGTMMALQACTTTGGSTEVNVGVDGCISAGGFNICANANTAGGNTGYPRGGYNGETRKVEIGRGPAVRGFRCPRGTDSEAVISNSWRGTNHATRICYDHRPK